MLHARFSEVGGGEGDLDGPTLVQPSLSATTLPPGKSCLRDILEGRIPAPPEEAELGGIGGMASLPRRLGPRRPGTFEEGSLDCCLDSARGLSHADGREPRRAHLHGNTGVPFHRFT